MQFSVILGNPPYGDKHNYLYCDFINQTISDNGLQPEYFTMITPSRYMMAADRKFKQIRQYFYSGCIDKTGHQIKIYKAGKDVFGTDDINCVYVDKDEIDLYRNNGFNEQALTKYKVHVPYDGDYRDRYKKNLIAGPGELTTLQFTLVRMFDTMSEAENLMKYLQTDLVIYLISSLQASFNITASNFRLVPDQDFTNNSDIDWSKGLADLNKQLYKKVFNRQ